MPIEFNLRNDEIDRFTTEAYDQMMGKAPFGRLVEQVSPDCFQRLVNQVSTPDGLTAARAQVIAEDMAMSLDDYEDEDELRFEIEQLLLAHLPGTTTLEAMYDRAKLIFDIVTDRRYEVTEAGEQALNDVNWGSDVDVPSNYGVEAEGETVEAGISVGNVTVTLRVDSIAAVNDVIAAALNSAEAAHKRLDAMIASRSSSSQSKVDSFVINRLSEIHTLVELNAKRFDEQAKRLAEFESTKKDPSATERLSWSNITIELAERMTEVELNNLTLFNQLTDQGSRIAYLEGRLAARR